MPLADKSQGHDGTRQQLADYYDHARYPFRIAIRTPAQLPVGAANAAIPAGAVLEFAAELTLSGHFDLLLVESYRTDAPTVCDYLSAELPVSRRLIGSSDVGDEMPNIAEAYSEASQESWQAKAYGDIDL